MKKKIILLCVAVFAITTLTSCDWFSSKKDSDSTVITPSIPLPPPPDINDPTSDLPPDPGTVGNATIDGIDSDDDGIRDDVEWSIYNIIKEHPDKYEQTWYVLAESAKLDQEKIKGIPDKETALDILKRREILIECLYKIYTIAEAYNILLNMQGETFNTEERVKADLSADSQLFDKLDKVIRSIDATDEDCQKFGI